MRVGTRGNTNKWKTPELAIHAFLNISHEREKGRVISEKSFFYVTKFNNEQV